jgi:hypothetical protein
MTWWDEFARIVLSPEWTANVSASLVGAAIAFVGALFLVLRQLRHDRELVSAQLDAMRAERIAERRAVAAGRLGRKLVEAATASDIFNMAALLEQARTVETPVGADIVYDAEDEAQLILDLDSTVLDIWRELLHTWRECRVAVKRHDGEPETSNSEYALGAAVEDAMVRPRAALDKLGRALIRWNGIGAVPSLDVLDGWSPIPVSELAANKEWRKRVQVAFESERIRVLSKREERDKKSSSGE